MAHQTRTTLLCSPTLTVNRVKSGPPAIRSSSRTTWPPFSSPEPDNSMVQGDSASTSDDAPIRRPNTSKRRAVLSTSEDDSSDALETTAQARSATRRTRVVLPESEDEDDSSQDSSDGGDSEEKVDDGVSPAKRIPLAERLRLHRTENPVSSSESEANTNAGGGDYTGWTHGEEDDDNEPEELGNEEEHWDDGRSEASTEVSGEDY